MADRGHRLCRVIALHSRLTRVHRSTPLAERGRSGARGVSPQFGSPSEGTGSPRNRGAGSVQLRVELQLQATSITSILTLVNGYSFSNTRIPKACALITTTCTSNKRSAAIPPTQSGWMVLGVEFEERQAAVRPLRLSNALLDALAILVPKPQLVLRMVDHLSCPRAGGRVSSSDGAPSHSSCVSSPAIAKPLIGFTA